MLPLLELGELLLALPLLELGELPLLEAALLLSVPITRI